MKYLASIESYFIDQDWLMSDAPGQVLLSLPVTPCLFYKHTYALYPTQESIFTPPIGWMAQPFDVWRGSITYRVQIVASGYHKGRLLAVWDPVTSNATPETNVVNSRVIDLAETKDFEITVGWGAPESYLKTAPIVSATDTFARRATYNASTGSQNGVLTFYVLNQLVSSGASTDPIHLVVSVKSDEMDFKIPDDTGLKDITYVPVPPPPTTMEVGQEKGHPIVQEREPFEQQADVQDDAVMNEENAAPEGAMPVDPVGCTTTPNALPLIFFGEEVSSFRSLLKRYSLLMQFAERATMSANATLQYRLSGTNYPVFKGYIQGALHEDLNGLACNIQATQIHDFLAGAFMAWRGSMRYKTITRAYNDSFYSVLNPAAIRVTRGQAGWGNSIITYDEADWNYVRMGAATNRFWNGGTLSTQNMDGTLEFEVPYYVNTRYAYTDDTNIGSLYNGWKIEADYEYSASTDNTLKIRSDVYRATGEDFTFLYFMGVPSIFVVATPALAPP
jgi:hypothetical protein